MHQKSILAASFLAAAALLAACGPKDVEVGPYTVSVIEKDVYHIQDCNKSNPAGEAFDAEGNKTHFNNCSDIYLLNERKMAQEVLSGKRKGTPDSSNGNLNRYVSDYGVTIRYNDPEAFK